MSSKEDLKTLVSLVGLNELLESKPIIEEDETLLLLCLIDSSRYFKLSTIIKDHPGFNSIQDPITLQLAVGVYRLGTYGNGCGPKQIAIKFSISEGSVVNFTDRVIAALTSLSKDWIRWPNKSERQRISSVMASKLLPNCVGFVDGTDAVLSDAPLENREVYWSRKKKYCMQAQIICDPDKVIRDLFVGYPGSVHDAKVFTTSPVGFSPKTFFSNGEYIVGDSAYPLSETVIVPFRNVSGLTREKRRFNYHLSTHRVAVEHTIGLLKGRFQSLKGIRVRVNQSDGHKKVCQWIHACAILHNMLVMNDPWTEVDEAEEVNEENSDEIPVEECTGGNQKREALLEIYTALQTYG